MSRLVVLAAAVLRHRVTNRQTHRQTNAAEIPASPLPVGVGNWLQGMLDCKLWATPQISLRPQNLNGSHDHSH